MDLVLDPIGGAHWAQSFGMMAPTGRIVIFGYADVLGRSKLELAKEAFQIPWLRFSPFSLMSRNYGVLGVNIGHLWHVQEDVARWARKLLGYYRKGDIRPHVDRTFSLADAGAAHAYMEGRQSVGKVVLVP